MKNSATRKLTAIVSVDVVGYSLLVGIDEQRTLESMRAHRSEFIDAKIERYGGHIFKTTGDGLLIEFPSAVNAVQCAAEIQREVASRDRGIPEDQRIVYRVGINLGDVVHEDGDIFGDGVNVATRIEALAKPGDVYVSRSIHEQISGRADLGFEDLGKYNLKNIAQPVHVYRVILDPSFEIVGKSTTSRYGLSSKIALSTLVIACVALAFWYRPWESGTNPAPIDISAPIDTSKPSIAVLPFVNMSGDEEQEYFVDGMTEDLITDLSKVAGLTVISRTSTFVYKGKSENIRTIAKELGVLYVVEGSVRKYGLKIRLSAQLIEAISGKHLWAERYDRDFDDVFMVQDEVRSKIISNLAVKLTSVEEKRLKRSLTTNATAFDLYLQGVRGESYFSKVGNRESILLFKQAIELDPNFAAAYARLGQAYSYALENNWIEDREKYIKLAIGSANKAIELDNELPYAYWSLARIHTRSYASDLKKAISLFEKSIKLNPNYADGYIFLATTHIFNGHAEKALPLIEKGMSINPFSPFFYHQALGMARFFLGNHEAAVQSFKQALEQSPTATFMQRFLMACYGYLGQSDDAEWAAMEYELSGKSATIKAMMDSSSLRNPVYRKIFEEGLRKGGLPEE